jgi:hypothetical protein
MFYRKPAIRHCHRPLTRPTEDALCLRKDEHSEEIPEKIFLQKKGLTAARLPPQLDLRLLDAAPVAAVTLSSDYTPFRILVTSSGYFT